MFYHFARTNEFQTFGNSACCWKMLSVDLGSLSQNCASCLLDFESFCSLSAVDVCYRMVLHNRQTAVIQYTVIRITNTYY